MSYVRRGVSSSRPGFTLLVVLFVLVVMGALASLAIVGVEQFVTAASNRIALTNAGWHAADCAARARAVADRVLQERSDEAVEIHEWRWLDDSIQSAEIVRAAPQCTITLHSSGERLDINRASDDQLRRLLLGDGVALQSVDSLRDAILDWRDLDTLPRQWGAEVAWYQAHHRSVPRDGPFASPSELRLVRGFSALDSVTAQALLEDIGIDAPHIDLARASQAVLATMPGMTAPAIQQLLELRTENRDLATLLHLSATLTGFARDSLEDHFSELAGLASNEPDAWILDSCGSAPGFRGHVIIELRLERVGKRVSVAARRRWED